MKTYIKSEQGIYLVFEKMIIADELFFDWVQHEHQQGRQ